MRVAAVCSCYNVCMVERSMSCIHHDLVQPMVQKHDHHLHWRAERCQPLEAAALTPVARRVFGGWGRGRLGGRSLRGAMPWSWDLLRPADWRKHQGGPAANVPGEKHRAWWAKGDEGRMAKTCLILLEL